MRKYDNVQIDLGMMGKTGFRLLAKQKRVLCELEGHINSHQVTISTALPPDRVIGRLTLKKTVDAIEGLLNLIDHIQDQAVDSGQVPEEVVFPFLSK